MLYRHSVVAMPWCAAAVLLAIPGFVSAPARAQTESYPWSEPEKPPKKKTPGPAAKPKPPAEQKQATPSASQDSEAEIAFWNSVKDSGKADELQAYLKQYPTGRFADLARLRLKEAERTAAGVTAPPPAGAAADSTAITREVQERLYKLNYRVTRLDGSLDADTDRAIKAWQGKSGFAPSGVLTQEQLKVLRSIVPASNWGAIAHPSIGIAVTLHSKKSRQEAEGEALSACKARHGVACKVFAVPSPHCIGVARSQGRTATGRPFITHYYSNPLTTLAAATEKAMSMCNADTGKRETPCAMIGGVCGNAAAPGMAPAEPAPTPSAPPVPRPQRKGTEQNI